MKTPIIDTPFEVKHLKYIAGFSEASFLSHLLNQCRQLGSGVRELNDKYPGSCLCLSQRWNIESYTIMLTVGVIILEYPMSGMVLKLFQPASGQK